MLKRNTGRIINISSEAGVKPLPQMIPYSVTKNNEPTSLIKRFATVKEVADTVVFLASEKASAINGHAQRVEVGIIRSL